MEGFNDYIYGYANKLRQESMDKPSFNDDYEDFAYKMSHNRGTNKSDIMNKVPEYGRVKKNNMSYVPINQNEESANMLRNYYDLLKPDHYKQKSKAREEFYASDPRITKYGANLPNSLTANSGYDPVISEYNDPVRMRPEPMIPLRQYKPINSGTPQLGFNGGNTKNHITEKEYDIVEYQKLDKIISQTHHNCILLVILVIISVLILSVMIIRGIYVAFHGKVIA